MTFPAQGCVLWFECPEAFEHMMETTGVPLAGGLYTQTCGAWWWGWGLRPLSPRSPQGTQQLTEGLEPEGPFSPTPSCPEEPQWAAPGNFLWGGWGRQASGKAAAGQKVAGLQWKGCG